MSDQRGETDNPQFLGSLGGQKRWIFLAAAAVLRVLAAIPNLPNGLFDDGYVTLRYAANLARGLGLVFNPGERVQGTTSPLFTFVLAAAGRVVGTNHLEVIALSVDILASLGMLYLCERILTIADLTPPVKWTYLAALAFLPSFVANSVSGMETPLVLFLMSLSLYLCIRDRKMALAAVGVLLFLSRVDTLIWLLALGIHILLTRKGRPIRELAGPATFFLAGSGAWLAFTKLYFGSVVPQSLVGKAISHGAFARPDWNYVLTFLSAFIPAQRFGMWGLALIAVVFVLMLPATAHLFHNYPDLRPVIYFFPLYVALLLGSRAPLFSWYLVPPKWAFYLLASYFLWRLLVWGTEISQIPIQPARVMALFGMALVALGFYSLRATFSMRQPNTWLEISSLIERDSQAPGRVFLEHIGLVGYHSNRYIYDYMGLVTPETTRLKQQYGPDWLTKAVRKFDADIVILYQTDLPAISSPTDPDAIWFRDTYQHVRNYHEADLMISVYYRKNSPRILAGAWLPATEAATTTR